MKHLLRLGVNPEDTNFDPDKVLRLSAQCRNYFELDFNGLYGKSL
ncbi:hypothetical protein [Mesohalobacter halotolerans]|nr:hypothetical protein [Mesohalobacter halotolerans]